MVGSGILTLIQSQIENAKIVKYFSQKSSAVINMVLDKLLDFGSRGVAGGQFLKLPQSCGVFFGKLSHYFKRDECFEAAEQILFHVFHLKIFERRALVFFVDESKYELF